MITVNIERFVRLRLSSKKKDRSRTHWKDSLVVTDRAVVICLSEENGIIEDKNDRKNGKGMECIKQRSVGIFDYYDN